MAIVKKYLTTVSAITKLTDGVYTITLKSDKKFSFLVGQFLHLTLEEYDPSEQWPDSRCFSIQTPPNIDELKITYSVKGLFTQRMEKELQIGKQIWIKLPYGDIFQRDNSKENCVFISGGTGITPFLSLFCSEEFKEYKNPVLYAGFRDESYNCFTEEISTAQEINKEFNANMVYQDSDGLINIQEIAKRYDNSTFFISGPPIMLQNFKQVLLNNNIREDSIITDDWE